VGLREKGIGNGGEGEKSLKNYSASNVRKRDIDKHKEMPAICGDKND